MKKKRIIRIVQWVLIIYAIIGIGLYEFQEKIIFHPEKLATDFKFDFNAPHEEVFIPVSHEDTIHMVHFKTTQPLKGQVLYFHGNRKNISFYYNRVPFFLDAGYDVWMPDYPGFGKTRGSLNEEKLNGLAVQVYKYVINVTRAELIVYGRSLGTGLASYIAAGFPVKHLVLETPYSSIPSLFNQYAFIFPVKRMCKYNLSNYEHLKLVKAPVTIFHGENDGVIPIREAGRLKESLKPGDEFVEIENGSHNDINSFPEYDKVMKEILK